MAEILVVNGVARFTVHGEFSGRQVANIIDMKVDTTGTSESRSDAILDQAGRILNAWTQHILAFLVVNNYVATRVSWVDLDAEDGDTGEISSTSSNTWPQAGAGLVDSMPGNVAIRVMKRTVRRRGEKQGRMYLCGLAENQTSDSQPNMIIQANVEGANGRLASFLTDITKEVVIPGDVSTQMHVVHVRRNDLGVIESTSSSEVIALEVDPVLGSQRRRLRG